MPETDQASQFITSLEPFYKVAYSKEENAPPIFNIFHEKRNVASSRKMNGHAAPLKENGDERILNTSHASAIHNVTGNAITHNGQSNDDAETTILLSNGEMNGDKSSDSTPSNEDGKIFISEGSKSSTHYLGDKNRFGVSSKGPSSH